MRSLLRLAPLALVALPFFACSSNKNYDERQAAATMDPDYVPPFDASKYPTAAEYQAAVEATCIGTCKPDPGSKPVDMAAAEKGYQFAWLWDLPGELVARATFTYDDNTPAFVTPMRTPSTTLYGWGGWEPPGEPVPLAWQGPPLAARFRGGPFTEYGGGVGLSLRTISNAIKDVAMPRTAPGIALLEQTPSMQFPDATGGAYDVSSYEGMAIWVRRGPDGQPTMRLGLTERNSAEDLNSGAVRTIDGTVDGPGPTNVKEGQYCRRWRICGCGAGTPCSPMPNGEYRCFDPAIHTPDATDLADINFQINYPHCGDTRCQMDKNASTIGPDLDPLFKDKTCNPAIEPNGHSEMFCWDPAHDEPPPSKRERCGNPFQRAITVGLDWQLIKVPFSELRQADEAQVAAEMDLHSVKQVAFTYTGGWIDFWVANIGFYRKLPQ